MPAINVTRLAENPHVSVNGIREDTSSRGKDLAGSIIIATFADGSSETLIWEAFDPYTNGGVIGTDVRMSNGFYLHDLTTTKLLTSVQIDLAPSSSVFDSTVFEDIDPDGPSTPGSKYGFPFVVADAYADLAGDIDVTYSGIVNLAGRPADGDLYTTMRLDFTGLAAGGLLGTLQWNSDIDTMRDAGDLIPTQTEQPGDLIDFNAFGVYGFQIGRQDFGDFEVSTDGLTLEQDSQSWDQLLGDFTVDADTRLQFDFLSDVAGEIHGIMFTNGANLSQSTTLQFLGSQTYGIQAHNDYVLGSGVQSYDIRVGDYFTGNFDRIVFLTDDDRNVGATSVWSNVSLDGAAPLSQPDLEAFDFAAFGVSGFQTGRQDYGDYTISSDGMSLEQDSQSWEQLLGDFTVDANTRLQFDFSTDVAGEIHGIMFTNGAKLAQSTTLQFLGSQKYGIQAHNDYTVGSGVQSYDIRVGDFFTGDFDRIVFLTDDDANAGAKSTWTNVKLDGATPLPQPELDTIDFSSFSLSGFQPGRQDIGDASVSANGLTLQQESQSWEQLLGNFTVGTNTRLQFDFSTDVAGEIHGIMFTNGENLSQSTTIQFLGSQRYGIQSHNDYVVGSGVQSYDIRVGEHFTGDFDRIVFLTDDDAYVGATSTWSNVQFDVDFF